MGLKKMLKDQGRTSRWLAKQVGVTIQTVSLWCKNKSFPSVKYIPLIADALDSTVEIVTRALLEK